MSTAYIGTSGWVYKNWDKTFYPEDVPAYGRLEFYTTQFSTVEVNATFYRLPSLKMIHSWRQRAPRTFVFAVKGSRYITHLKKLTNLGRGLSKFTRRIGPLRPRLGPILWQLPRILQKDARRLDRFLSQLPGSFRHAVEFRHPSWYCEEIFDILRDRQAAHVSISSQAMPEDLNVTADFAYIRFHGLEGGAAHDYTRSELEPWAGHIRDQVRADRDVFAYFNNDLNVAAPANAKTLMEMVGGASRLKVQDSRAST